MSNILWVDLETTGSEIEGNSLIEIGSIVTDNSPDLNEIGSFTAVIHTEPSDWLDTVPVVIDMHTENGLMADSLAGGGPRHDVVDDWADWALELCDGRIPLAGSGVAHFDRKWIDYELAAAGPTRRACTDLAQQLQYWAYDIGPARRFSKLAKLDLGLYGYDGAQAGAGKLHRGLADIRDHAVEARAIIRAFKAARPR